MLEQVLGLDIDVQLAVLRVLGEVEGGDLGDVLVLALTLLLLQLEGDAADGATLNALHQVGSVAGNLSRAGKFLSPKRQTFIPLWPATAESSPAYLVAQTLRGNNGDLIADALVGLEVQGELGVVPLNDDLGGLLNGLGANATHLGGVVLVVVRGLVGEGIAGLSAGLS